MRYQLKWDEETLSGFVRNDVYKKGYVFEGLFLKPKLPFDYESLEYDEVLDIYVYSVNNKTISMDKTTKVNILNVCSGWVDTTYIDNPKNLEIHRNNKYIAELSRFNEMVKTIVPNTPTHEMISWRKQEQQARAWSLDNTNKTPIIDALLISRDIALEDKESLVKNIVLKAEQYEMVYGSLLGRWQKISKAIAKADSKEALKGITW